MSHVEGPERVHKGAGGRWGAEVSTAEPALSLMSTLMYTALLSVGITVGCGDSP